VTRSVTRRRAALLVLGAIPLLLASGCTGNSAAATSSPPEHVPAVVVERGDVVAVVTLDGAVVPSPVVTVAAASGGAVRYNGSLKSGTAIGPSGPALFTIGSRPVRAVAHGTFTGWTVPNGSVVPPGLPVAKEQLAGFGIEAATPPDLAYRIFSHDVTAKAEIRGGPAGFSCPVVSPAALPVLPDPNANSGNAGTPGAGPSLICVVPPNLFAVPGMRAFVAVQSAIAHNVLTLPVGAVAGTAQSGNVWLLDTRGVGHERTVQLGLSNGSVVQITAGLAEGDHVSSVSPDRTHFR
jgi:macrolide-specific efflux system membrane fusion protein